MARLALADCALTSTLPPSHARLASDRVRNRHATSSHTSRRTASLKGLDEDLDRRLCPARVDERLGLALAVLILQVFLDAASHFLERNGARRLLVDHPDDVKAEPRLDQFAGLARGKGEGSLLEGANHLPALEVAEIAAGRGAAGILRVLFRERGEVGAGLRLLQDVCG